MRGVYVYDLESLQLLQKFPEPVDTSYGMLAFSPDGRFLMCSREDGFIDIWSLATFEHVASFEAHKGPTSDMRHWSGTIGGLNWSTTGYIATGGTGIWRDDMVKEDLSIRIWKVEDE
jgi:WD40 repeat protein